MADLIERVEQPYRAIYEALHDVRETFHREGRISDANAKLDETVKLLRSTMVTSWASWLSTSTAN